MPFRHIPERTWNDFMNLTLLGSSRHGDFKKILWIHYIRKFSSMMKKTPADLLDPHMTFVVNSCQGKVAGVLF